MSAIIVISPKLFASEVSELLSRLLGNTRPSRPYYPPPTIRRPDESNKKKKKISGFGRRAACYGTISGSFRLPSRAGSI